MVPGVAGSIPVGHPAGRALREALEDSRIVAVDSDRSEVRSSIGRAPVSKTGGWGFDSLRACGRWMAECSRVRYGTSTAVSSRGLGHSPLKAGTRVRIPLPLWERWICSSVWCRGCCCYCTSGGGAVVGVLAGAGGVVGPIVYRLGRDPFKVERRVRLPLGL